MKTYYTGATAMAVLGSRTGSPTRLSDIEDGLTTTVAFSENLQADSWGYVGKPKGWSTTTIGNVAYAGDDLDPVASPRVHISMVWLYRSQPSVLGVMSASATNRINGNRSSEKVSNKENARPSSMHKGFVHAAMLGGSVSTLGDKTDYVVYQALLTPNTHASDVPDRSHVLREAEYAN